MERILSLTSLDQVVVSTADLRSRINQWIKLKSLSEATKSPMEGESFSRHARPNLPNQYVAPRNQLEQTIAEIWQTLLGVEAVGIYDNFFELGGHSLLATQIVSRLRQACQLEAPLHILLEAQTVAALGDRIEKMRQTIQNLKAPAETNLLDREEIEL